ncbi:MAG: GNAT family N-acetyltransferase, partial [Tateyamaria sp.]
MEMEKIVTQPMIETERFVLRPLRKSDKGLIELYWSDVRVARMTTSIPHPVPPGMSEAYVTRAMEDNRDADVWAMDGLKSGGAEVMGLISLERMDRNQSEIAYWVAPPFWNTGLA